MAQEIVEPESGSEQVCPSSVLLMQSDDLYQVACPDQVVSTLYKNELLSRSYLLVTSLRRGVSPLRWPS
jgi:hypothetical protein